MRMYEARRSHGRNAHKILVGKPERKRTLGIARHRWKDNIEVELKETRYRVWTGFIWLGIVIRSGLLRVNNEPSGYTKGGEFLDQLSDY
jgi:hypothetical protein